MHTAHTRTRAAHTHLQTGPANGGHQREVERQVGERLDQRALKAVRGNRGAQILEREGRQLERQVGRPLLVGDAAGVDVLRGGRGEVERDGGGGQEKSSARPGSKWQGKAKTEKAQREDVRMNCTRGQSAELNARSVNPREFDGTE